MVLLEHLQPFEMQPISAWAVKAKPTSFGKTVNGAGNAGKKLMELEKTLLEEAERDKSENQKVIILN